MKDLKSGSVYQVEFITNKHPTIIFWNAKISWEENLTAMMNLLEKVNIGYLLIERENLVVYSGQDVSNESAELDVYPIFLNLKNQQTFIFFDMDCVGLKEVCCEQ